MEIDSIKPYTVYKVVHTDWLVVQTCPKGPRLDEHVVLIHVSDLCFRVGFKDTLAGGQIWTMDPRALPVIRLGVW